MVRRVLLPAVILAVLLVLPSLEAAAGCRAPHIVGVWERENEAARIRFFANKTASCRLCDPKISDRCQFMPDPADAQGRKQCPFKQPDGKVTTLSGWTERNGLLDKLAFADGTTITVGDSCRIDGKAGTMKIEGLGTFVCDYEYHCRKLAR